MSKVTHTQGTWTAVEGGAVRCDPPQGGFIDKPESVLIAVVYGDDPDCKPDARREANARLIAASPDLLKALEMVWDSCCKNAASRPSKKALLAARAAIISAGGSL